MLFRVKWASLALILSAVLFQSASGQVSFIKGEGAPAVATTEVSQVLEKGAKLELERRWGEALTLYEDALRRFPSERNLERGFQFSRMHYDLGRRYRDSSFSERLVALPERDALALYTEVLLMIQSHHVDSPNWRAVVDHGTSGFEVSLADPVFIERHLGGVPADRVDLLRRDIRARLAAMPISTRLEARDAVAMAARLATQHAGVPSTPVVLEYLCGAANSLDEYSNFLTADQLDETYAQIEGNFVGLGVELKVDAGSLVIMRVIPNSPAERGGMLPLDQIVAVGGRATSELDTERAADMLQGAEGTWVDVTVVSPGQPARVLRIRREQVEVPSVDDVKLIDPQFGIGYFKLTCFQKTTVKDLDAALWKLHREGMRSLVMDLRGNPGGLLTSSVEVADRFIEEGTIVSTRGRNTGEDFNYSAQKAGTWKVPLVVLIDGDSASASEIFAGAIRDHHRGEIVGTRSYGKGSVQGIFTLNAARSGIRLTTAKFFSPAGRPYSRVGVEPHVVVRQAAKPANGQLAPNTTDAASDAFVDAALQIARRQLARR